MSIFEVRFVLFFGMLKYNNVFCEKFCNLESGIVIVGILVMFVFF